MNLSEFPDHPRGCGENLNQHSDKRLRRGSPPQVRGKPIFAVANFVPPGITPAGAGKTPIGTCYISGGRDHPRRCGENGISVPSVKTITGSPPQVRGKPTLSGKNTPYNRDHPRRCGENFICTFTFAILPGSPPQVRGKLISSIVISRSYRITPAGAGKTERV